MSETTEENKPPHWGFGTVAPGIGDPPLRKTPGRLLKDLASACYSPGASNPIAIIHDLSEGIRGMSQPEVRTSVEVKIILGQLSYLLDESLGPSFETLEAYRNKTL